jgi:hypothetical protein
MTQTLSREDLIAAVARHGSQNAAARALGIAKSTFNDRMKKDAPTTLEMPAFVLDGDEDEPIEGLIDRMARQFERAKKANDARRWFPIGVSDNKPIGILFVGDPHVDDNGCNWPALREHISIARSTPGLYAVNIGDTGNDWGGRLVKKYADQDTSVKTAGKLVRWLLLESGVSWLAWLHGNHQHMGGTVALHEEMNRKHGTRSVPMLDWEARFVLKFKNGEEFKINTAHDFAGNSMWNPVHGAVKAAKFGNDIDVLVCGHKHNWAISQWEQPEQGNSPLMIRVRGYKHLDEYARRIGKYEQEDGQSILVVLDPTATTKSARCQAFVDVKKGAEYLTWLRSQ